MRTVRLIVTEKSNFKEKVYAVTDRQTDRRTDGQTDMSESTDSYNSSRCICILNMKTVHLIVTEESKFLERVYGVTDGRTDRQTCLSAQTVRTYSDVYAYQI